MVSISLILLLIDSISDLITLSFISALLIFSLFSLSFILHFRLNKNNTQQQSHLVKNFNSIWTVRILLVSFISLWALTHLLRLPFIHRHLFPSLSLTHQANLCQIHVVLSQGLFQPGFLLTLLFLVNFSIKKNHPNDDLATFGSSVASIVLLLCLPILFFHVFFLFFLSKDNFPDVFGRSFVILNGSGDGDGDGGVGDTVLCAYPLFSTIVFGSFATIYVLFFLIACWNVVSVVINKGLRFRIYALAFTVLLSLLAQVVFLAISALMKPDEAAFDGLELLIFLSVLSCAVVGEGILVIRPIADALDVLGWRCQQQR